MTADKIKAQFDKEGKSFTEWARQRGYKPQAVIAVINGYNRGRRGTAHRIAVDLGLKKAD